MGLKELPYVGMGGEIPNNGSHAVHVELEPLGNGLSRPIVMVVGSTYLEPPVHRRGGMLKQVLQLIGASHGELGIK